MSGAVVDSKIVDSSGDTIQINKDTGQLEKAPDPLMEAVKLNWSDLGYLHECYESFLAAVQVGASKDYHYNGQLEYVKAGQPVWNEKDTFFDWIKDVELQLDFRLHELYKKFGKGGRSDSHLLALADGGVIEDTHPFFGKKLDTESFEVLEFIVRKSKEAVEKFRAKKYTLAQVQRGTHAV